MKQAEQWTKDTKIDQAIMDMASHARPRRLEDECGATEDL